MAQDTFAQIWNRVLLYAPGTPVPLVQTFVKNAYQKVLGAHYWSELLKEGQHVVRDEYSTGTVQLTGGSASVTVDGGGDWTGLDGMTVRFKSRPQTFTIDTVDPGGLTATLDRPWDSNSDAAAAYVVGDFYIPFPADLGVLDDVRDLNANWRLRRQVHQMNYLDRIDPDRTSTGSPILYVAAPAYTTSAGVVYPRYEFWPQPPAGTTFIYRYFATSDLSAASDRPVEALKPETLVYGALAELALWPGTLERPNPFFSVDIHKSYVKLFEDALSDSELGDLDRMQRMLIHDDDNFGFPADANWLQSHGIPF